MSAGTCARLGLVRESLEESERTYRLDALDPMSANLVALARMATGRMPEAISVYKDLVERVPDMSFPVSSLLRAYALQQDWAAVDELLELAAKRQLREFHDGLPFIHAKRNPSSQRIDEWRDALQTRMSSEPAASDISRLVYSAHLGLVDDAYRLAETSRLGPAGGRQTTSWVRTDIAPHCCFNTACRNCASTRASRACARDWGWWSSG